MEELSQNFANLCCSNGFEVVFTTQRAPSWCYTEDCRPTYYSYIPFLVNIQYSSSGRRHQVNENLKSLSRLGLEIGIAKYYSEPHLIFLRNDKFFIVNLIQSYLYSSSIECQGHHPLNEILPKPKPQQYNLRRKVCLRPKINTERFMNTFVNRLIFEHNLL